MRDGRYVSIVLRPDLHQVPPDITLLITMTASQPLLETIEADVPEHQKKNTTTSTRTLGSGQMATAEGDAESGMSLSIRNHE